jgi:predicted phosphodiesterase
MIELFVSDIHFPFEDKAAWGLFLEVAKSIKPDLIFMGGDIGDFYSVSKYDKDPSRKLTLEADINYQNEELRRLRQASPRSTLVMLEGNHETRMTRFLESKASVLSNLSALRLENLLGLKDLDIKWIPNGTRVPVGKLWHLHGNEIGGSGANVARAKYQRLGANIIFGHLHVMQNYIKRTYDGETHGSWANGCLCLLQPEYSHFTEWIQSFTVVEYARSGNFNVDQVPIIKPSMDSLKASCMLRGKEFVYDATKMPNNAFEAESSRKDESRVDNFAKRLIMEG